MKQSPLEAFQDKVKSGPAMHTNEKNPIGPSTRSPASVRTT
jgi:hypothetical protein